jgi:hypothetical protein
MKLQSPEKIGLAYNREHGMVEYVFILVPCPLFREHRIELFILWPEMISLIVLDLTSPLQ